MDLQEFNEGTPTTKPWLNPVVDALQANTISVAAGTATVRPVPYNLWRSTDEVTVTTTPAQSIQGAPLGLSAIPAAQCYAGMTVHIKAGVTITTSGNDTITFSIRNATGSFTYGTVQLAMVGAVASRDIVCDFDIQIAALGGAGVGIVRSIGSAFGTLLPATPSIQTNSSTFSSAAGVDYTIWIENTANLTTLTRNLAYATVIA